MRTYAYLLGALLWMVSIWLIITALGMPVAAASAVAPVGFDGIVNLQLLFTREMLTHLGIGAAIIGTLIIGFVALLDALSPEKEV